MDEQSKALELFCKDLNGAYYIIVKMNNQMTVDSSEILFLGVYHVNPLSMSGNPIFSLWLWLGTAHNIS